MWKIIIVLRILCMCVCACVSMCVYHEQREYIIATTGARMSVPEKYAI